MRNPVHVITYVYFPQARIFAELELNQTKPQLRFSENQKKLKHTAKMFIAMLRSVSFSYLKRIKDTETSLWFALL